MEEASYYTRSQWKQTIDSTDKCRVATIYVHGWRVQILDRHCLLLRTSPSHVGKHANNLFPRFVFDIKVMSTGRCQSDANSVFLSLLRSKNLHWYMYTLLRYISYFPPYKFCTYCNPVNSKCTRAINL